MLSLGQQTWMAVSYQWSIHIESVLHTQPHAIDPPFITKPQDQASQATQ